MKPAATSQDLILLKILDEVDAKEPDYEWPVCAVAQAFWEHSGDSLFDYQQPGKSNQLEETITLLASQGLVREDSGRIRITAIGRITSAQYGMPQGYPQLKEITEKIYLMK